jgi:sec-independent protein translocase protein TatA
LKIETWNLKLELSLAKQKLKYLNFLFFALIFLLLILLKFWKMGGSEILLILLAVLVLFGADKLPEFARSIGKGMREIKKATDEIKDELTKETQKIKQEVTEFKNSAPTSGFDEIKKDIDDSVK